MELFVPESAQPKKKLHTATRGCPDSRERTERERECRSSSGAPRAGAAVCGRGGQAVGYLLSLCLFCVCVCVFACWHGGVRRVALLLVLCVPQRSLPGSSRVACTGAGVLELVYDGSCLGFLSQCVYPSCAVPHSLPSLSPLTSEAFDCEGATSVEDIKTQLCERTGLKGAELSFNGRMLEDVSTALGREG